MTCTTLREKIVGIGLSQIRELYCEIKSDPLWQNDAEAELYLNENDTSFDGTPSTVNNEDLQASYATSRYDLYNSACTIGTVLQMHR